MRGAPNFAERRERACARKSSFSLGKIGSPAPRCAAPAASLTRPDRHGAPVPSSTQTEGPISALHDHIQELRAELRGCLTRRERATVRAELAAAIAAQAERDRAVEARREKEGR
jgi:hypothetical protein